MGKVINGNDCGTNVKGNWVYFGYAKKKGGGKGKLVYIGTTMQRPSDRFRWHRHNGKDLVFEVQGDYDTTDAMLIAEVELINKHNPALNKKKTKHNDNRPLSGKELHARKGDKEWCQSCLRRRVNAGYKNCYWCSKGR